MYVDKYLFLRNTKMNMNKIQVSNKNTYVKYIFEYLIFNQIVFSTELILRKNILTLLDNKVISFLFS